ncbi:MAG: pseudouridine synthase [Candidatus Alcyoniella australis]|nr:pseudouridine synthase [Candidatus Alcyoniella australis]
MDFAQILYRDEQLLVLNKPSGMLVHRGWARAPRVLTDLVRELGGGRTAYTVHRLDRATSGVIVFALDQPTAAALNRDFDCGAVRKHYIALVRGRAPDSGVIDYPIPARKPDGERVPALTEFRLLQFLELEPRELSLVEALPRSGRLHQVRRHLRHIDHPLINDSNYGDTKLNRAISQRWGLNRLGLHSAVLELTHPTSGERLTIRAPLPDDLAAPLSRMGFELDGLKVLRA